MTRHIERPRHIRAMFRQRLAGFELAPDAHRIRTAASLQWDALAND
jgi:hypothetical protein